VFLSLISVWVHCFCRRLVDIVLYFSRYSIDSGDLDSSIAYSDVILRNRWWHSPKLEIKRLQLGDMAQKIRNSRTGVKKRTDFRINFRQTTI